LGVFSAFSALAIAAFLAIIAVFSASAAAHSIPTPFCTATGDKTLCTDLDDYAPNSTVHISGSGFDTNSSLAVHVTRPDGSVVTGDGSFASWPTGYDYVIAGSGGAFEFDYVLDGIAGVYTIRVYPSSWDGNMSEEPLISATFTDGNVKAKAAPSGTTFNLTFSTFNNTNCTGSPVSSGTANNVDSAAGQTFGGLGTNESVKLTATAFSNGGVPFFNWTSPNNFTDLGNRTICVQGFASGTRDYFANYTAVAQAKLIVIKTVINNNGGNLSAANFTIHVNGTNATPSAFPGSASGTNVTLNPGSYNVTEDSVSGYTTSFSANCTGTILSGETRSCTITNDDIPGKIIVIKNVINDNGGNKTPSNFTINVSGGGPSPASFPGSSAGTNVTINASSYNVTETLLPGYNATFSSGCSGNITNGEVKVCNITNDDVPANLIVYKFVINDNGGALSPGNFTIHVQASDPSPESFNGSSSGTNVTLDAGNYNITEDSVSGYSSNFSSDCVGSISNGETKVCNITNDDIAAKIIVIKKVVNNNGGTAQPSNFTINVTGNSPSPANFSGQGFPGTIVNIGTGPYNVTEISFPGYAVNFSAGCSGNITAGETKFCNITNDDLPATLIVIKKVVNNNTGALVPSSFIIFVNGTAGNATFKGSSLGVSLTLNAGTYNVTEGFTPDYNASFSANCSGTLKNGENKTCTITNDDAVLCRLHKIPTRDASFWRAQTNFTTSIFSAWLSGNFSVGNITHLRSIDSQGKLFGAYFASISSNTTGRTRSNLDIARMTLLQQLVTAKLNCAAFGCAASTLALIAQADNAYAGNNASLMRVFALKLMAYNSSGRNMLLLPALGSPGAPTSALSQALADRPFWNSP